MKNSFTVFLLVLSLCTLGFAQKLTKMSDRIIIENEQTKSEILISIEKPSAITSSVKSKRNNLVIESRSTPWFEFCINNSIVNSNELIWRLIDVSERKMENGGKEFAIKMKGTVSQVAGLVVTILIQCYPNDDFFRERIILTSEQNKFSLNNLNGKNHFIFGSFNLPTSVSSKIISEELRLATWNGQLINTNYSSSFDNKQLEKDWRAGRNLEQNYMYHPKRIEKELKINGVDSLLGPISAIYLPQKSLGYWMCYEHGSPDNESDQKYLNFVQSRNRKGVVSRINLHNGGYFDNQIIDSKNSFSSPWFCFSFFEGKNLESASSDIWKYLNTYICENSSSRKPLFYYNTWGMQRDESTRGNDVRGILTESKIKQEIDEASELGIDLFVLDDGWQDYFGDWNVIKERLPNGLGFYFDKLKAKGIMPGLWIAPLATDPNAEITKQHPEWLIRDDKGLPLVGQWKMNFFCFKTEFKTYFIQKCKSLIDQGVRYFKWDGVNTYQCQDANHNHGGLKETKKERVALHGYSLPLEITDAIKQLKEYQPDLIIEIDVTEPNRNVGLAYLSEARYFWMNNGAGWYGEYSPYRGKSTRMITNLYGSFMPTTLQTYACFPMYDPIYKSQMYNVNSSLVGGRGFWGNISIMAPEERKRVGNRVREVQKVEEKIANVYPTIVGRVGSSPEIYEFIDKKNSIGKVIAFSGSAIQYNHLISGVNSSEILGILQNSYSVTSNKLNLHFDFYSPDDSKIAIMLPNNGSGISILSSTSWLQDIKLTQNNTLEYHSGAVGEQKIIWPKRLGMPVISGNMEIVSNVLLDSNREQFIIMVSCIHINTVVRIKSK